MSLLVRAFFSCDSVLGEVQRHVLLLLWCRYIADLDVLVQGAGAGLRSGMRGAVQPFDVSPCRCGCIALAGVLFCGVGATLSVRATWRCTCYSVEHLRLPGVPLVPILNAIMQQGARGTVQSHSSGQEDNLALCALLNLLHDFVHDDRECIDLD